MCHIIDVIEADQVMSGKRIVATSCLARLGVLWADAFPVACCRVNTHVREGHGWHTLLCILAGPCACEVNS